MPNLNKETITHIKKNYSKSLKRMSTMWVDRRMQIPYFSDNQAYSINCFETLFRYKLGPILKDAQFTLKYYNDKNWFDYRSLFKEFNNIYSTYFRIVRYKSGFKNIRIIDFEFTKEITPELIDSHWIRAGIYIGFTMLRLINANYEDYWKDYFAEYPEKMPIKTWTDLIYTYYEYIHHEANDDEDDEYDLNTDLEEIKYESSDLFFKKAIRENYLNILKAAYGSGIIYTKINYKDYGLIMGGTQTKLFRYIKKIVALRSKNDWRKS